MSAQGIRDFQSSLLKNYEKTVIDILEIELEKIITGSNALDTQVRVVINKDITEDQMYEIRSHFRGRGFDISFENEYGHEMSGFMNLKGDTYCVVSWAEK